MDVMDAINTRISVRSYSNRMIPEDVVGRLLEAARISPSASNMQPWHFIVVSDPETRAGLSEGPYAKFLKESPIVIVGLGDRKRSPKWYAIDTTIALQTIVLQATAEGLGTCWIGSFFEDKVRQLLKVPDNYAIVAMLSVGYPKEQAGSLGRPPRVRNRKELPEIVSYEQFGVKKR